MDLISPPLKAFGVSSKNNLNGFRVNMPIIIMQGVMCVTGNQFSIIEKFHDNGRDWHTLQKGQFAEFVYLMIIITENG